MVAPIASAQHVVGGKAKGAVLASINPGVPIVSPDWRVIISANSWATSQNQTSDLGEWVYVSHLKQGRWQYVGGFGEGIGLACTKVRIPKAIAQDLKVYCALSSTRRVPVPVTVAAVGWILILSYPLPASQTDTRK